MRRSHSLDGKSIECKPAQPKQPPKGGIKDRKIFVGGLCADVTDREFRSFFEQYGKLEDCIVMRDKETGRPRGFGFITFSDEKSAKKVLYNYHHNRIRGNWIDCKRATPKLKSRKMSERTASSEKFEQADEDKQMSDVELKTSSDEMPSAASIERFIERLLLDDDL